MKASAIKNKERGTVTNCSLYADGWADEVLLQRLMETLSRGGTITCDCGERVTTYQAGEVKEHADES